LRGASQVEVDHAHMAAEEAGLHRGLAVDRAGLGVERRRGGVTRVGEDLVRVAKDQGVEPRHGGKRDGGVLHLGLVLLAADPGMAERHDEVRPRRAQARHLLARGLDKVAGPDDAAQRARRPSCDLGRPEP
jgi:hypothetical protein